MSLREELSKLRKGQMALSLDGITIMDVTTIIILAIGALILAGVDDATTDANASNIAQTGLGILDDILGWVSLVVIVLVAVIILFYVRIFRGTGGETAGGR